MKKAALLLLSAFSLCAANFDFKELPFEEKISDRDLSLAVTFDKMQTNADFAKGNPLSSLSKLPLGLRNLVGIDGKNAFSPEGGERLFFFADRNCDIAKGTIVMWVRCDYPIENCANAGLFSIEWEMNTLPAPVKTQLFAYLYKGRAYACWSSMVPPATFGNRHRHVQNGAKITAQSGEWFQIAVTWDEKELKIYVNGDPGDSITMLRKFSKVVATGYDKSSSTIGFKVPVYGDRNAVRTVIDDIKVFTRVLSPDEIKARYAAMVQNPARLPSIADIRLSGVEKEPNVLEADINLVAVPGSRAEKADILLTGPDGYRRTRTIPAAGKFKCRFDGITKGGDYELTLTVDPKTSAPVTVKARTRAPDLAFVGFRGGDDNTIPPSFVKPVIDTRKKSIGLWNKTLYFGNTPYPRSIVAGGREMLRSAPHLTVPGKEIKWGESVLTADDKGGAVLTGSGKLDKGFIDFKTFIEFDGLCRTVLTLRDLEEMPGLSLSWQVAREFCEFLQLPRMSQNDKISASWPLGGRDPYLLWLASEQGGLSWMPESDANWRYRNGDPLFFADRTTGQCQVRFITFGTKIPTKKLDINTGLFLATPTRALISKRRGLRYGGHPLEGGFDETMGHIALWGGLRMHKDFEILFPAVTGVSAKRLRNTKGYHCIYYGMNSPWGSDFFRYFKKYVAEPGGYTYTCNHLRDPRNDKIVARGEQNPCRMTSELYHDYVMWHLNKLLTHRYADKIRLLYDDLCGVHIASSPHDFVTDAYGREIRPFDTAGVRKFLFRQLRLLSKAHIPFMLHGQNAFTPAIHSIADYWLPGEEYEPEVRRTQDPFFYCKYVSDKTLRCEANSKLLGVSVLFLPAGISYKSTPQRKFDGNAYVNALAAKLLPFDIEFKGDKWFWSNAFRHGFKKIWDNMEKGGVFKDDIIAYRWFDKMPITSSNPDVRIAAYDIRDGRWFLILANVTGKTQRSRIDISKIAKGSFSVPELHAGEQLQVKDGVFGIEVPAYNIRMLSIGSR